MLLLYQCNLIRNIPFKYKLYAIIWTENWFWVAILNLCKLTTLAYLDCSIF